ncbi:hypothetical protein E2986_13014 [Frieseomelitta varia]|uniref:Uncharacterized protein n=1 Tax=Frieseomelitta varia TaxID=561572 RepID=A0A833RLU8_9HYME|nr:hypothetical protein E2986_13014 [Frieseomelitta varia]
MLPSFDRISVLWWINNINDTANVEQLKVATLIPRNNRLKNVCRNLIKRGQLCMQQRGHRFQQRITIFLLVPSVTRHPVYTRIISLTGIILKMISLTGITLRLSLGGGLIVLASALSDASLELPGKYSLPSTSSMQSDDNGLPQYQYGWCLQLSGLALILAEVAAVLTMSGYMARFSTVEEMVPSFTDIKPHHWQKLLERKKIPVWMQMNASSYGDRSILDSNISILL